MLVAETQKISPSLLYSEIEFDRVNQLANKLADIIEEKSEQISNILLKYESYEVVSDETDRALDLLRNLKENEEYFKLRVGPTTTFLPRNQPLYAFSCFVIVPSLMSTEVHFRIPHSMKHFFGDLLEVLEIQKLFPNVFVSKKERLEFLTERSALRVDPKTGETWPVTDVVIFTGKTSHAEQLKTVFDKRTLFITNGSGHNPVVVSDDANIENAVEAVISVQFYNQGQDCAAPNSILVHKKIYEKFILELKKGINLLKVGEYSDRECTVGPTNDLEDLVRVQELLVDNYKFLDNNLCGIIDTKKSLLYPTLIEKDLSLGGNFTELFSPIVFVQKYEKDEDLNEYFENPLYAHNSMYISLFGTSKSVLDFLNKSLGSKEKIEAVFLHNTHLHSLGVERGVNQYGGYGEGASCISINGNTIAKPTLPQREIYEYVVKPIINVEKIIPNFDFYTEMQFKKVYKILRMQTQKEKKDENTNNTANNIYLDLQLIKENVTDVRYAKLQDDSFCSLLDVPNVDYISSMSQTEMDLVHNLSELLKDKDNLSYEEFKKALYDLPKMGEESKTDLKNRQAKFFLLVYELLFGIKSGPKLTFFLKDVPNEQLEKLLDV